MLLLTDLQIHHCVASEISASISLGDRLCCRCNGGRWWVSAFRLRSHGWVCLAGKSGSVFSPCMVPTPIVQVLEWILASLSYVQKLAGMVRVYPMEQVLHCIWSVLQSTWLLKVTSRNNEFADGLSGYKTLCHYIHTPKFTGRESLLSWAFVDAV